MKYDRNLFSNVLHNLDSGKVQADLSKKLNECIVACRSTGKQSDITLKIKIKPIGHNGQYEIIDTVTHNPATPDKPSTTMFGTPDGNLTYEKPEQKDLGLYE